MKQDMERIKLANKKTLLMPIDFYILHFLKLSDEINVNKKITAERIVQIREEVKKLTNLLVEHDKDN